MSKPERLSHASVEASISEMWAALELVPDHERALAADQAKIVERDLRNKLKAQDRLDRAAPKMLEALKAAYVEASVAGVVRKHVVDRLKEAIDLAEKGS